MGKPKTDDELVTLFEEREKRAGRNTTLDSQRAESLQYYQGDPFGNESDDRSSVVMRDVFEVVEWIKPSLLRIFTAGDRVVAFQPQGPQDIAMADQETDYVNHCVMEQNEGFLVLYQWFTDALLMMNGYVVLYWVKSSDVTEEIYEGLTEDQLAMLSQDEDVTILEKEESQIQTELGPLAVYTVKLRRVVAKGELALRNIPPERVFVSHAHNSVSLRDADFCGYWEEMSLSELRDMFPDADIPDDFGDEESTSTGNTDQVYNARNRNDPVMMRSNADSGDGDAASRIVRVRIGWMKVDADGDGIAERRRMVVVGNELLYNEIDPTVNMAVLTPTIMAHRHVGIDVVQIVKELQLIKSMLMRGMLDNMYLSNNGRYGIDEDRVNIDDLLVSRPGGVVRVTGDPGTAITALTHPAMSSNILQVVEYLDGTKEERTGVSRLNQGLDANTINKTEGGQIGRAHV